MTVGHGEIPEAVDAEPFALIHDRALPQQNQIARTLGIEILTGVIQPGAILPGETELLTRFRISRTVLREVMKTLAAKGFIVSKARVGTRVQTAAHWNFFDPDVISWKMAIGYDATFRDDLAEIRRAIEPRGAALAARRRSGDDIALLRRCIARMRAGGHSRRSFAEADLQLHLTIAAASGNPLIRSIGAIIEAALVASFTLNSAIDEEHVLVESIDRHEAIVDAIEAGDEAMAAAAMLHVIEQGTARIEGAETDPASKRKQTMSGQRS